jgi:hypothetical protein
MEGVTFRGNVFMYYTYHFVYFYLAHVAAVCF